MIFDMRNKIKKAEKLISRIGENVWNIEHGVKDQVLFKEISDMLIELKHILKKLKRKAKKK